MLMTVFVVLMILWLLGGGYLQSSGPRPAFLTNTILPWTCVAILGWVVFGGPGLR